MPLNISAISSNLAPEPAPRSADTAECDAASPFFVQLDLFWKSENPGRIDELGLNAEENAGDETEENPATSPVDSARFFDKPADAVAVEISTPVGWPASVSTLDESSARTTIRNLQPDLKAEGETEVFVRLGMESAGQKQEAGSRSLKTESIEAETPGNDHPLFHDTASLDEAVGEVLPEQSGHEIFQTANDHTREKHGNSHGGEKFERSPLSPTDDAAAVVFQGAGSRASVNAGNADYVTPPHPEGSSRDPVRIVVPGKAADVFNAPDARTSEKSGNADTLPLSDDSGLPRDSGRGETADGGAGANRNAGQNQSRNHSAFRTIIQHDQGLQPDPASMVAGKHRPDSFVQGPAAPVRFPEPVNAGASASVDSPKPSTFIHQISERIRIQVMEGGGEIRIKLQPDGFGHLEIRAETTTQGVVARILAESETVRHYLENSLHLLQQHLQEQGIKVDRVHVAIQNGTDSQDQAGHAPGSGHAGSGQQGREANRHDTRTRGFAAASPDELVIDLSGWERLNPKGRFHTIA